MRHLTPVRFVASALSMVAVALLFEISPAAGQMSDCKQARPLALNETVLVDGPEASSARLFALEIQAPGFLAVELTVPGFETIETWIDLLPDVCSGRAGSQGRAVERSLNRQLWEIPAPGRYHVRVSTVAPDRALARYKLSTRLLPDLGDAEDRTPKDSGTEECDEEILPCARTVPAPISKDTGAGECDDVIVPCAKARPCQEGEPSDDLTLCARGLGLGRAIVGELGNAWGDDHDYFVFTLDRARTVRLETSGALDTFGVLFDASSGERLASADSGGEGENFALAATLRPGRYHVRVEGMPGAEGTYRLRLSESE